MSGDIIVVDLGLGNVMSVCNMLDRIGRSWTRSVSPVNDAPFYFLPGVGSFDAGMERLTESGWADCLIGLKENSTIVGLCLGMQLLSEGSEEGVKRGLGLLPGRFKKFDAAGEQLKVPHMGWNSVSATEHSPDWVKRSVGDARYYFVHSYFYPPLEKYSWGTTAYGRNFASIAGKRNVIGLQFHPEKSHKFGSELVAALLED